MAYDSRYRVAFLVASMTTALVAAFDRLATTFNDFGAMLRTFTEVIDWPDFIPSARESIALDLASRERVDARQPGILARFAEFIRRALAHDEFSAGHFDPGRMLA